MKDQVVQYRVIQGTYLFACLSSLKKYIHDLFSNLRKQNITTSSISKDDPSNEWDKKMNLNELAACPVKCKLCEGTSALTALFMHALKVINIKAIP